MTGVCHSLKICLMAFKAWVEVQDASGQSTYLVKNYHSFLLNFGSYTWKKSFLSHLFPREMNSLFKSGNSGGSESASSC